MNKNNIRILLVDDEEKILVRLGRILEKEGYATDTASDADTAMRKLGESRFDIVLTDLNMPEHDGFDIMDAIKSAELDTLPLVLTGYASVESAIRAIQLGAYDFIQKPVDAETLKLIVNRAAERVMLKRQNDENLRELEKLNELKDEFLSVVSHDLRSPLSSIGGYANYLIKKGGLTDTQVSYISIIREIASNLYSLVNELLDISKIEAGVIRLNKERTDIDELIGTSINNFLLLASDKNTVIRYKNELDDPFIMIDRMKILQVINNLVTNAIKFTENGSITVRCVDDTQGFVTISVKDTGIGIPHEAQNGIFDKYSYFHEAGTRGESGTGLGLVICKRFVELHGGTIWASSEPSKGSTFVITLPREPDA